MKKKKTAKLEGNAIGESIDLSAEIRKLHEALDAIEQYKAENPGVDVGAILSKGNDIYPMLRQISSRELDKFVAHAKEQGTGMSFDSMETGVLSAGRKDMQNGLAEILNSLKFEKPACSVAECGEELDNLGRSKKKIITSVGEIEVRPERLGCLIDNGQSAYPLLDFIGLVDYGGTLSDGSVKTRTIKCSRNAAASIALVCSESSYEQASLVLNRLAGLDLTAMTAFRITDSVGSEFVKDVHSIEPGRIEPLTEKISGNIIESRINETNDSDDKDEIIRKALEGKPDGVLYKSYHGPVIKVMYIMADGTGVPGRPWELAGVKGKQSDGSAKTFEAKIGAVFTIDYTADGRPLLTESGDIYRDKNVIYMGTVRKVDDFGHMLFRHALQNGLEDADAVIFLGDGAKWLWGIQQKYFPYALCGIDLYHATERANAMVDLLQFKGRYGANHKQEFKDTCVELLHSGDVQGMLDLIRKR